ncbi:serine carboxypeptidase [Lentinus brumalis]|uniref:Carboxypeptidase n=1 Tax=Lentinus brumalis TaxID=2498619 RepID=A0A371DXK3_9APHY|nr:serine carboxypeptidase [Polyporus brumalis]
MWSRQLALYASLAVLSAQRSHAGTVASGGLRIVENSGECETVPGVHQASGYADIDADNSMYFWFFEARENPETAPLTLWLQGGCSLVGLYQENGPCRINNDSSSVSFNPFSWNNVSNMIYIDQPIPTGFSQGNRNLNNSVDAAQDVWQFLQVFFADPRFEQYQNNDFGIWTESYGGHYGPIFAKYFLDQNAAVASGSIDGVPINLKNLGIGDGLTDPLVQYESYFTYAQSNPYFPTATNATLTSANQSWSEAGGCRDLIVKCYNTTDEFDCAIAQNHCDSDVAHRLSGSRNPDYILADIFDTYPPDITLYVNDTARKERIGAVGDFTEVNSGVLFSFAGEWMQNSRPTLEAVVDAGVRTILYVGDAVSVFCIVADELTNPSMQTKFSSEWAQQDFSNFTVHGEPAGLFKNAGTLSYLRIFGAGHEVPAYKFGNLGTGEAALQMFSHIVSNNPLSAT